MARNHRGHKPWDQYPIRTCMTMHHCQICQKTIRMGEFYYDGGLSRRVHTVCADNIKEKINAEGTVTSR